MSFRDNVRTEMEYRGITAKELAAKAGISINTLNMYIGYRESIPSADIAVQIADALNVSVEQLVREKQKVYSYEFSNAGNQNRLYEALPNVIYGEPDKKKKLRIQIDDLLDVCSEKELSLVYDLVIAVKKSKEH